MHAPQLTLIPAPDEPPDPENLNHEHKEPDQNLEHLLNATTISINDKAHLELRPFMRGGGVIGSFFAAIGPALGTALGAWLHARYGRKVRLKIGEIEAKAQTPEEVEKLIAQAHEIQQRNAPKIIQEP